MSNYICPRCGIVMLSSEHVCPADLQARWEQDRKDSIKNFRCTPMPKIKPPRKEITMSHNTVKFKDMRSVDKAMLLLAKHEGEEIICVNISTGEHPMESATWDDDNIYYVVPKARVKPEPKYKTMFVDNQGNASVGNPLRREGIQYIEIKALGDAIALRHMPKDAKSETLAVLMGYVK